MSARSRDLTRLAEPQARHPLWDVLDALQMDARALQARIVAVRSYVASLDLSAPPESICERCGAVWRGPRALAEHVYLSHEGPVPPHWLEAEAKALDSS